MRALAALLWLLLSLVPRFARSGEPPSPQRAQIVLMDDAPREGLTDALQIHAPAGTRIVTTRRPDASTTAARIRQAHAALSAHPGAQLALWLDEDVLYEDQREVVVYLVARRRDSALVEVVRVRAGAVEELDRAIAIKAREVLDTLASTPGAGLPGALARPERSSTAPSPLDFAIAIELGAFGATDAGSMGAQLGGRAALGVGVQGDAWHADVVATARLATPWSTESAAGSVEVDDLAFGAAARVAWQVSRTPLALGGWLQAGARLLHGRGTTPLGTTGTADRAVPFIALGPELRLTMLPWLRLRTGLGVEVAFYRQYFAVNEVQIADAGRARGVAEVGLVATAF